MQLTAPFPWFGGKARAAGLIWDALGNVPNYVAPFAGSLADLLRRPHAPGIETVNDKDGFICNFWRAVQQDPQAVAHYADWPVNECDLHARHAWLVSRRETLTVRLEGDPDYADAQIAGWWCWGLCCWIGGGWCSGNGPWVVEDGELRKREDGVSGVRRQLPHLSDTGQGVHRQRPHLGNAGQGVHRTRPHLGDAGQGVHRKRPHLGHGQGAHRPRPHLGGQGCGMGIHAAHAQGDGLVAWMQALCVRLRRVRVCCGDWTRVLTPAVTCGHGLTGIYLDPPYGHQERTPDLYAVEADIGPAVQAWCLANGSNPLLRIVLSGYEGEYALPGWRVVPWRATAGYSGMNRNRDNHNQDRERLWLSPACERVGQLTLFRGDDGT